MGWLKKDDLYHDHAKVDGLSDAACRLWDICGCWCSKKENWSLNGVVPRAEIMSITKRRWSEDMTLALAQELVDANPGNRFTAGLWEVCEQGWFFHDWAKYQLVDEAQPLTLTERASRAGQASKLARIKKYGTAQPFKKIEERSNLQTSSISSVDGLETGTNVSDADTKLPVLSETAPELVPELSKKTDLVRGLVRDKNTPETPSVTELDELVRRTKPRTYRTPVNPLRDLKLKSLSKGPDRDPHASDSGGEREIPATPIGQSVTRPKPLGSCERDARSYEAVTPEVVALFEAWRDEAQKPNAELTWRRREGFELCVSGGVTVDIVRRVVRGAKTDLEWAVGRHRLDPTAILFSTEQREKYLDIEVESRKPPKRTGPPVMPPEPKPDSSTLVSLDEMQQGLASLGIAPPAKPKDPVKVSEPQSPPDPATIERIDRARAKSRQRLEEFDRDHKSEPPPPFALEA